jgi:hypothetical protein
MADLAIPAADGRPWLLRCWCRMPFSSDSAPRGHTTVRTRYRIIIMGLPIGSIQFEGPLMSQDDDFLHIKTRSGTMRLAHPM